MGVPISIVIIAKNEEKRIKDCINSVLGWVDEIIVVDDGSTDATRQIADALGAKVFSRKMEQEGAQRNFGVSKAKNDWVMMLDCDERVTDELKKEIEGIFANPDPLVGGYWVPQKCFLGEHQLVYGGWSNPHIRLYHRNLLKWREVAHDVIHPGVDLVKGYKGKNLTAPLVHYNFASAEDFLKKVNYQTTMQAIKWHMSGKKISMGKAIWRTIDRFFRRFIGKGGHKDGFWGFYAASMSALYELASYAKLREIKESGYYLDRVPAAKSPSK